MQSANGSFLLSGILGQAASRWPWTTTWWPGHTLVAVISVLPCRARKKPSPSTNEQWEFGPSLCVIRILHFFLSFFFCSSDQDLHVGFSTIWVLTVACILKRGWGGQGVGGLHDWTKVSLVFEVPAKWQCLCNVYSAWPEAPSSFCAVF